MGILRKMAVALGGERHRYMVTYPAYFPIKEPGAVVHVDYMGAGLLHYHNLKWDWEAFYW